MFLIGIAGGSGSGKTTFAKKILNGVKAEVDQVGLLHQDSYYLQTPPSDLRVHGEPNFDHPAAFDWDLLRDHLSRLKKGETVRILYNRSGSAGPGGYIEGRALDLVWDGT